MNDAFTMSGVHGAGKVGDKPCGLPGRHRDAAQSLAERTAVNVFQRKERPAGRLADFVDLDDIGMLKAGDDFRFRQEAGVFLRPYLRPAQDHFEGDDAVKDFLARLVDDAHAAAADFTQDIVASHLRRRIDGRAAVVGRETLASELLRSKGLSRYGALGRR